MINKLFKSFPPDKMLLFYISIIVNVIAITGVIKLIEVCINWVL